METLSPTNEISSKLSVTNCSGNKFNGFKLENNNVKCESCSVDIAGGLPCVANCNVKCESDYKCDMMKCEQCMKEGQMAILEIDKDSGIVLDDKLDGDSDVKEELNDVVVIESENWKKPDYEPTVQETVDEKEEVTDDSTVVINEQPRCQKITRRKLSLDSLSDNRKKRKVNKRALSADSSQDFGNEQSSTTTMVTRIEPLPSKTSDVIEMCPPKKKGRKETQKRKTDTSNTCEGQMKKMKNAKQCTAVNIIGNCSRQTASDTSIMATIDDVIQQSLQMTKRKDRKNMKNHERVEKKRKNLLSTVKKMVKKVDIAKELTNDKLSKVVAKSNGQSKNKVDTKPKSKMPDNKTKAKSKSSKSAEIKCQNTEIKMQDSKVKEIPKKHDNTTKTKVNDISEESKKLGLIKKKRKTAKKGVCIKKPGCKVEDPSVDNENLTLTKKTFLKPKWSNGWSWENEPFEAKVYLTVKIHSLHFEISPFHLYFGIVISLLKLWIFIMYYTYCHTTIKPESIILKYRNN